MKPEQVVSSFESAARVVTTHSFGVIMNLPRFIFIIGVITPNGRELNTSIFSACSSARLLVQMSRIFLLAGYEVRQGDWKTPVQEAKLIKALLCFLFLRWGMRAWVMRQAEQKLVSRTEMISLGLLCRQGVIVPLTPALFITIPISILVASSESYWDTLFDCYRIPKSPITLQYLKSVYISSISRILLFSFFSFRATSTTPNPISTIFFAKQRPMPSVHPVITTKQSPYLSFNPLPLTECKLKKKEGAHFQKRQFLQSLIRVVEVIARIPAIMSALRTLEGAALRKS